MSGEIPAYQRDNRWFHAELSRRGHCNSKEGDGSAFAERVAIKIETCGMSEAKAREGALEEYLRGAA